MSRGALLQLVAKGEMDNYLIDNDIKKSIFQNVIKKITNFSEAPYSFFPINNAAGYCFIPYVIWLSFASFLTSQT